MAGNPWEQPSLGAKIDLASDRFEAKEYVKIASAGRKTQGDLEEKYHEIQDEVRRNAKDLKANVYRNYHKYIDASHAISKFESDMQGLKERLDESGVLYKNVREMMATGAAPGADQLDTYMTMLRLVSGFDHTNALVAGTKPEHHGRLMIHDPTTAEERGWVYAFLFPQTFVVARFDRYSKGGETNGDGKPGHLTFDTMDPLSVVSLKSRADTPSCKNSFFIQSPEKRLFSCATTHEATTWKDVLRAVLAEYHGQSLHDLPPDMMDTTEPTEPWVVEMPSELEVFIAQRAFQDAVVLACEAKEYLAADTAAQTAPELRSSIEERIAVLGATLCVELDRPTLRKQAIHANVELLLRLGESECARRKFLSNREAMIRRELRKLKIESSTELYMRKHAVKYFGLLKATSKEFGLLFDNAAKSEFIKWVQLQLQHFADVFYRQVFQPSTTFDTVAECIELAHYQCRQLADGPEGIDLEFHLSALLEKGTLEALDEAGRRWSHDVASHLEEHETWKPYVFRGKVEKQKFMEKMGGAGVCTPEIYCYKDPVSSPAGSTFLLEGTQMLVESTHQYISAAVRLYNPKLGAPICSFVEVLFPRFMQDLVSQSDGGPMYARNALVVRGAARLVREKLEAVARAHVPALREVEAVLADLWQVDEDNDQTLI